MQTTSTTKLIGVLGHPVAGGNIVHDMFSRAVGISGADFAALLFDAQPKELSEPVTALQTLGSPGVYLTGRLRTAALSVIDYLSDEAHGSGVVNTVVFGRDQATGHNTEATAIIAALEEHRARFVNGTAVILGSGAVAGAAAYAVIRHFRMKHLTIADRNIDRAQVLKQSFTPGKPDVNIEAVELFPPDLAGLLSEAHLIINATIVGAAPNAGTSPLTLPGIFSPAHTILDSVFAPARTRLLNDALSAGATVIGGDEILLRQVGKAYELLTGATFPSTEIRQSILPNSPLP